MTVRCASCGSVFQGDPPCPECTHPLAHPVSSSTFKPTGGVGQCVHCTTAQWCNVSGQCVDCWRAVVLIPQMIMAALEGSIAGAEVPGPIPYKLVT